MRNVVRPILIVTAFLSTALTLLVIGISGPKADSGEEPICPLSEQQEKEAIEAFHTLAPIFKEPRCINCHGAVDPFKEGGGHLGGVMELKMEKVEDTNYGGMKDEPNMEATLKTCQDCHSLLPGWALANHPSISFTNKSEQQLCLQMKFESGSPEDFMDHIAHDRGGTPFIAEAFKGTRALDENGQATYVNATGKDYELEPPRITHATLIAQAQAWANAVGKKYWKQPEDCGCAPHKYKAKINQRWEVKSDVGIHQSQLESHADFLVDLTFKSEGSFFGIKTVPREFVEHAVTMGVVCDGKGTWVETWAVAGMVNAETHEMTVKVRFESSPRQKQVTCYSPNGPITKSASSPGFSSDSVSTPLSAGFRLPARVGAKRHFEWSLPPGRNTVDIEFIKAKS